MCDRPKFMTAYPYQQNVLTLPVQDLDAASEWYGKNFGMNEQQRTQDQYPSVIMERDGVQIGFAITGEDPEQDGAAVLVSDISALRDEFAGRGIKIGNWRIDERDGQRFQVFFVVAPDRLCYYFHEKIEN